MPSPTSAAIPDDTSIFDQSSPESLRARALSPQLHDHISSTSDEQTLNNDAEYDYPTYKRRAISNRSSISSFPGSVIHTVPFTDTEDVRPHTPFRSQSYDRALKAPVPSYLSTFRNPSSVRALQLESEWADSDASSTRHNVNSRRSPKIGSRSPGSAHSSPSKRLSRPATPKVQSKLKKEFPLVLLHCSLLPPTATAYGPSVADEILQAVLPEQYRKRWKTLQDKVVKNNEVKQRGVLISHPREDYDLLEERLLESLELERPRIRRGHFLGSRKSGDSDSGFESSSQNGTDEASDTEEKTESQEKCSDCGTAVSRKVEQDRHWEIKVFAANGLMKSGAWAAAWEEMEKVDVEVGIWMPEDVRTEVEERLKALQAMEEAERPVDPPPQRKTRDKRPRNFTAKIRHDERMREIYGEQTTEPAQEVPDGLADPIRDEASAQPETASVSPESPTTTPEATAVHLDLAQEDFVSYMKRHARILSQDQRNLAIVLLSMLVLIFGFQNAKIDGQNPAKESVSAQNVTLQVTAPSIMVTSQVSYVTETVLATSTVHTASEATTLSTAVLLNDDNIEHLAKFEDVKSVAEIPDGHIEQEFTVSDHKKLPALTPAPSSAQLTQDEQIEVLDLLEQSSRSLSEHGSNEPIDFCVNSEDIVLQKLQDICSP